MSSLLKGQKNGESMLKRMGLPGLMLASLALVGASATAASAQSDAGRPGQRDAISHSRPTPTDNNICGNGNETEPSGSGGDSQNAVVCVDGDDNYVEIHNEQGVTAGLVDALLGVLPD
jgi:hypothetical protein